MKKEIVCSDCGASSLWVARGLCKKCYAREYRKIIETPENRAKAVSKRKLYRLKNQENINAYWRKKRSMERKAKIAEEKKSGKRKTYPRSEAYKAKVLATYEEVNAHKLKSGCVDCGYNKDAGALDFDHKPEFDKKHNISVLARSNAHPDTLWSEIAKCEVRCANCHRVKTATRRLIQQDAILKSKG